MTTENAIPKKGRAAILLSKVIAEGEFELPRLATELVVSERAVAQFASGEVEMPLERQACLAQFLITNSPKHARAARNLLGQVHAAAAFKQGQSSGVPNSHS